MRRHPAHIRCLAAGLILTTALGWGCGDDDDSHGTPPVIESLSDENANGLAVIGEHITLVGTLGAAPRVTIGGIEAPQVAAPDAESVTVRVPPGVAAGEVEVIAENDYGDSEPVPLLVRRLVYTADFSDLALSVLEVDGLHVGTVGRIAVDVPPGPFAVAFTPDGRTAVVPCGIGFLPGSIADLLAPDAPPGDSVAIVDVITGATVAVLPTGEDSIPTGVAVHPNGQTAYVTNFAASTVSVIDLVERRLIENIDVPRQPEEIAVRADGAFFLVNSVGGTVSVVDTETLEIVSTTETGGNDPSGVAWSDDGQTGYVANSFTDASLDEDGTLTLLDLQDPAAPTVTSTIAEGIGPTPFDVDLVPGRDLAVVTNLNVIFDPIAIGPGSVSLVDLGTSPPLIQTVAVGSAPIRAAVTGDGNVALVGNGLEQTVSIIDLDTQTVTNTLALESSVGPADVAIQP